MCNSPQGWRVESWEKSTNEGVSHLACPQRNHVSLPLRQMHLLRNAVLNCETKIEFRLEKNYKLKRRSISFVCCSCTVSNLSTYHWLCFFPLNRHAIAVQVDVGSFKLGCLIECLLVNYRNTIIIINQLYSHSKMRIKTEVWRINGGHTCYQICYEKENRDQTQIHLSKLGMISVHFPNQTCFLCVKPSLSIGVLC